MPINTINSKSENNKKHFAGFLNMARNNVFIAMKYISRILKFDDAKIQEDNLYNCDLIQLLKKQKGYKSETINNAIYLLDKNFPFLKPFIDYDLIYNNIVNHNSNKQVTFKMYYDIFELILKTLNAYRNEHTHYDPVDVWSNDLLSKQSQLVKYMKHLFDGARRKVKERFSYNDKDMLFLTGEEHFKKEPVFDKNNYLELDKRGRKRMQYKEREDYYFLLHTKDSEGRTILSTFGLIMLIALFIPKQYTKILIDRCGLYNGRKTSELEKKIIFEILCIYRQKFVNEKFESVKESRTSLSLDILNELQKCPKELFDTLSPERQNDFRVKTESGGENLLVRFKDRFPYLALRYIDENNIFSNIRFQVSLGKYKYKFYNKCCIDSYKRDRVRSLEKEINGFGKLNEIEKLRKIEYEIYLQNKEDLLSDTADSKPYITNQHSSYKITANRVGLIFNRNGRQVLKDGNYYLPELKEKNTRCEYPECWLSTYDLSHLIFLHIISEDKKVVEKIIKDCVKNYKLLFADIKDGVLKPVGKENYTQTINNYNLNHNAIPKEIKDFLCGKVIDIQNRWYDIKEEHYTNELEYSEKLYDRYNKNYNLLGTKDNKIGKTNFIDIRDGKLALWLASDIIKLQPTINNGRDKLTGLNYTVMQSVIATFNGNIENLKRIFLNAQLIGGTHPHPFLHKVIDNMPKNTKDFYQLYLKQRITYFNELTIPDKRPNQERWKNRNNEWYCRLADRYLNAPIELPRGLFDDKIKEIIFNTKGFEDLSKKKRCNITYIINEYFKRIKKDCNQSFYDTDKGYLRSYQYFNLINNERIGRALKKRYFNFTEMGKIANNKVLELKYKESFKKDNSIIDESQKLKQLHNEYTENEKKIRLYKVQDIILFMMAYDSVLGELMNQNEKNVFRLCDIHPLKETSLLSMPVTFQTKIEYKNRIITIKQNNLKIKNYGDFFKFIYDQRIKSLIPYLTTDIVDKNELEKELDNYENIRPEIFGFAHKLEKQIIENDNFSMIMENNEKGIEIKNSFSSLIRNGYILTQDEEQTVIEIRNAFSHNSYPKNYSDEKLPEIAKKSKFTMESIINRDSNK